MICLNVSGVASELLSLCDSYAVAAPVTPGSELSVVAAWSAKRRTRDTLSRPGGLNNVNCAGAN